MSKVEVKKQQGRMVGVILLLTGLSITIITAVLNMQRERTLQISESMPQGQYSWIPAIGVAIMIVGGILLWKSMHKSPSQHVG